MLWIGKHHEKKRNKCNNKGIDVTATVCALQTR
jgi:hypothetical protein